MTLPDLIAVMFRRPAADPLASMRIGTHVGSDLLHAECLRPGCRWAMSFSWGAQLLSTINAACRKHPCRGEVDQ